MPALPAVTRRDGATNVNGLRLAWSEWSSEDTTPRQPSVLLLHGLASSRHIWDLVAPTLALHRRVVAIDQRGHGESDKPDSGYAIEQIIADDRALVDSLGLTQPVVVGHSWGGAVALAYAATHPEAVSGLVLVDGGATSLRSRPNATWEQIERDLKPPDFAGTPREAFIERMRNRADLPWRPEFEEIILNIVRVRPDDIVEPRLIWANHRQILRALWEFDPSEHAAQVRCAVSVILADRGLTSAQRQRASIAARRREADATLHRLINARRKQLIWYPDTAHDIPLHRPEQLAAAIEECASG
jgi:pimeloyl-ACP methyl ester carboxylesterase